MASSSFHNYESIFKSTKKDNKNDFGRQSATEASSDAFQRSMSSYTASKVNGKYEAAAGSQIMKKRRKLLAYRLFVDKTIVLVQVDEEKTRFYVHTSAALEGGFKEAESKKIELLEDSPHTFELFLGWIYSQECKGLNEEPFKAKVTATQETKRVKDLYIFADKVRNQSLGRELLNKWFKLGKVTLFYVPPMVTYSKFVPADQADLCVEKSLDCHACLEGHLPPNRDRHRIRELSRGCNALSRISSRRDVRILGSKQRRKRNPFDGTVEEFYEPTMLGKWRLRLRYDSYEGAELLWSDGPQTSESNMRRDDWAEHRIEP